MFGHHLVNLFCNILYLNTIAIDVDICGLKNFQQHLHSDLLSKNTVIMSQSFEAYEGRQRLQFQNISNKIQQHA